MSNNPWLALLGEQIKKVRLSRDISQEDLAFEAGISRSYCSGVERGVRNISAINLIKIAKVLEVEVGDLFPIIKKLK